MKDHELNLKKLINPFTPVFIKFNNSSSFFITIIGIILGMSGDLPNLILINILRTEKINEYNYIMLFFVFMYIFFLFLEIEGTEEQKKDLSEDTNIYRSPIKNKYFMYLLKPFLILYSFFKKYFIHQLYPECFNKIIILINYKKSKEKNNLIEKLSEFLNCPKNEVLIDIFEYPDYWPNKDQYQKNVIRFYKRHEVSFDIRMLKDNSEPKKNSELKFEVRTIKDQSKRLYEIIAPIEIEDKDKLIEFNNNKISLKEFIDVLTK